MIFEVVPFNGCFFLYVGVGPVISCSYAHCWETALKPCGLIDSLVSSAVFVVVERRYVF